MSSAGNPELLHFVELRQFSRRWDALGLNLEEDLSKLQWLLMENPRQGPVITGTRSLRKLRFTSAASTEGKRGAFRVLYVYLPEFFTIALCVIYDKRETANLSTGSKRLVNALIDKLIEDLGKAREIRKRRQSKGRNK